MGNKENAFYADLKRAVEDGDMVAFGEVLQERTNYLETIHDEPCKKEKLVYFIETDKEIAALIENKKNGFKELLLTQNNQLKAVKKYDIF